MLKLSIIMPVYNAENFLKQSIESLLKQTFTDFELICIDDGSTDNSLEALKKLSEEHSFIKIYHQKNNGSGSARNKGIKEASGKYISFLDADDIYLEEKALEKIIELADKNDADMIAANLKRVKTDGSIDENYDYENTSYKYFKEEKIIKPQEYGIPWAFYKNVYKKSFIQKYNIAFPDLKRGQDPIFLSNVLVNIKQIHTINVDLYGYNYSIDGGVNFKTNTYEKKYDYVRHFRDSFEILKMNHFDDSLTKFKKEFVDYILFENNIFDEELIKIIQEIFSNYEEYFKKDDYGYNLMTLIINYKGGTCNKDNSSLLKELLLEDNYIEEDRLKKVINTNQKQEDMYNNIKQVKKLDYEVLQEKRDLLHSVGKKENEVNALINSNNDILTSKSWTFTESLRSLKHLIKK